MIYTTDSVRPINTEVFLLIKAHRDCLTEQEYRTLRGQVLAGNPEAAERGLKKILRRKQPKLKSIILPDGTSYFQNPDGQGWTGKEPSKGFKVPGPKHGGKNERQS